jgi:ABC-2 type transport system ATP-binding protein
VGVINHGEVIVVEEKTKLMRELGKKELVLQLAERLDAIPSSLDGYKLDLSEDHSVLTYHYDTRGEHTGITALLGALQEAGIRFNDLQTSQSSLEEIFVGLVKRKS